MTGPGAFLTAFWLLLAAASPAAEDLLRYNNLGIAYLAQFKPAEAEKQFRQAIALDPGYVPGHVNAGIAALAQVHYEDAVASFEKALSLDPDNIWAHFNLSLIYKLQGQTERALTSARRALELDPRDPDIHYHVGSLLMTTRQYDEAIRVFEAVLRLDPNFLSAYYSMGRAYMGKGDIENGKKWVEKHRDLQAGTSANPAVGLKYGEQGVYSYAMDDTAGDGPVEPLESGSVTFKDVTPSSGITFSHSAQVDLDLLLKSEENAARLLGAGALRELIAPMLAAGVAVADVDGDGAEDLFFTDSGKGRGSSLYRNAGKMRFDPVKAGAPAIDAPAMAAAFGDLDSDVDADLVVATLDRVMVFINDGAGRFTDVSASCGVSAAVSEGVLGGVSLADVDHDGDLDIFVAGFLAAPSSVSTFPEGWPGTRDLLFINATGPDGKVAFTESAGTVLSGLGSRRTTGAVFSDFDSDRDIDIAVASPGDGTTILSNRRDGTFDDLKAGSGLPSSALVTGLASGDYNKDGKIDLVATTWTGGTPRLFRNVIDRQGAAKGSGAFASDAVAFADVSRQLGVPQFGVAFLDFDNDGTLDLAAVNGSTVGPAIFVYRGKGDGTFQDVNDLTGAGSIPAASGRGLATADLDLDGDLDLIVSNAGGPPRLLRNDGGNKNHWVRVAPRGLHSNRPGVGTKVEIKAGRLWQKQEVTAGSGYMSQSSMVPHFGLGKRTRVDTARLLWPGGVLQDEVQIAADSVLKIEELDRKGSSCPILYAWNGAEMAFVSDFLGGSAIGYRTGKDSFNYPDTDEYVKVAGDQLAAREGALDLRLVNQLEETIYFDGARLLAVDHPAGTEVFPDERLMPSAPFPEFRIFSLRDPLPPLAAWNDAGHDLRRALARIDRDYASPPPAESRREGRHFKGYAPEHHLTLDLGPVAAGNPIVLLLHGWIDYADSTSNLAASQAGLTLVPPYLEALDDAGDGDAIEVTAPGGTVHRGRWVRVVPQMGFPAGLPKTMTVDLTGLLPEGARLVRIGTSMRIHWDQIRVATDPGPPAVVTGIEASSADLGYRGFPAIVSPDGRLPDVYDYASDQPVVHWKSHVGAFTRYGDVRELLLAVDDRYVITRPGDEIALSFPSRSLPPLPEGWTRDYLLFADGFGKDMDLNSAHPERISPLPFHGMTAYPHPKGEAYPLDRDDLMEYLDTYNTRLVLSPLAPLRAP